MNKKIKITLFLIVAVLVVNLFITNYTIEKRKIISFSDIPVVFGGSEKLNNYKNAKVVDIDNFHFVDNKIYQVGVFIDSPDKDNNPMHFNFKSNKLENINIGHAFLVLIMSDDSSVDNSTITSVGLYPEESLTLKDLINSKNIQGKLENDINHSYTHYKIIKTYPENFQKLISVIKNRKVALEEGSLKYNTRKYNSVTFIADVLSEAEEIDFVIKKTDWSLAGNEIDKLGAYKTSARIISLKSKIIRSYNAGSAARTIEMDSFNEKLGDEIVKLFKGLQ